MVGNSIFDSMRDLSDEEIVFEIFIQTINNMNVKDRKRFINLLKKGTKING